MTNTVFIQANPRQMLGARISAYSYKRNSRSPRSFDVRIMTLDDFPRLKRPGQSLLRAGHIRAWNPDDLQSFSPLRFAPPTLLKWTGRSVVTDPDCFGVGDIAELFKRNMRLSLRAVAARESHKGGARAPM